MQPSEVACALTSNLLEELINQVETVIDEERSTTHSAIADLTKSLLPTAVGKLAASNAGLWLGPIVTSGAEVGENLNAPSRSPLSYDIVRTEVGARANGSAALCVRTLFVEPTDPLPRMYQFLLDLQQTACTLLVANTPLKEVYTQLFTYAKSREPSLLQYLPPHFGYRLDPSSPQQQQKPISPDCAAVAQSGELYAVVCSLRRVPRPQKFNCSSDVLAVEVTDTVRVNLRGGATVLTSTSRRYADVSYFIAAEVKPQDAKRDKGPTTRSRQKPDAEAQAQHERRRKQRQKELRNLKGEELRQRFLHAEATEDFGTKRVRSAAELCAYASLDAFPEAAKGGQVVVDVRNEAVILPIHGQRVPFHVSTVKNVSKNEEGKFALLRLNFHSPGQKDGLQLPEPSSYSAFYIREITVKSANSRSLFNSFRVLKELIKRVKAKDCEAQEKRDLVAQAELVLLKGKRPTLPDLTVRPNITGKRSAGTLEAHQNGLRFTSTKGEKLDILYENVKHAIFQPVQQELTVLLHFHLRNPIMIGTKRSSDVQFYSEAGVQSDDLGARGRTQDLDEIQQEQRERRFREKLNRDFKSFVDSTQAVAKNLVDFDIPYRELGFFGVPNKAQVFLVPSVNCLVNLTEQPFFVVTLSEIEVVHLERVQFALKAFDLVLLFKDYSRPPVRISNIPTESLEGIKDWLNDIDLVYSESTSNYNWANVMKEVTRDLHAFVEQKGWEFLQEESEEEEAGEEERESQDSSFQGDDISSEESAESDESEYSEDSDEEEGSDASEGMDWDELEEATRQAESKKRSLPLSAGGKRRSAV